MRVTFIAPHSVPAFYLVPLICSIMTLALATKPSRIPSVLPAYQIHKSHYCHVSSFGACMTISRWVALPSLQIYLLAL
jgi:hypothetical protein